MVLFWIRGLTLAVVRALLIWTAELTICLIHQTRLSTWVDWLEAPSNRCDNCGSRMKGWLVPPVTGDYEFWIASDDNGSFWLSTNNAFLERRCHVPGFTSPREWTKYSEQKSAPIRLIAGQAYYYWVRLLSVQKKCC